MIVQFPLNFRTVRTLALTIVVCAAGAGAVCAQTPAPDQQKQPAKPPAEANPFPGDTSNVPVLPSGTSPAARESNEAPSYVPILPSGADDPVRSPDDAVGNPDSESASGFSSSSSGLDKFVPPPDEETRRRRGGKNEPAPEHHETAKEDETVGGYYLEQKNWRAAMSRFESAVVLDPENPDVYWGLAEAQRHMGQFAGAKANYEKVMEYDPDSKHAKEAKKLLNSPELAKATAAAAPSQP
jgi:tetratricopeptide (TPR) repeat protein